MAEDEEIAALVIDNGSGMCKGTFLLSKCKVQSHVTLVSTPLSLSGSKMVDRVGRYASLAYLEESRHE
jgi:hypothetical protein